MTLKLHGYWRAGAPYRVRIALNLKGLTFDYEPVNLLEGDQHKAQYRAINPQRLTPALDIGDGDVLTQSLAIMEWLDETHPEPPLLPRAPLDRQRVRAMAGIVACDIHPLNNARVLRALSAAGLPEEARKIWTTRWIVDGFKALEPMIAAYGAGFAFGSSPTIADCCLIPQIYSAERFDVDLSEFPAIRAVGARAAAEPAFAEAHPDRQPDAPGNHPSV